MRRCVSRFKGGWHEANLAEFQLRRVRSVHLCARYTGRGRVLAAFGFAGQGWEYETETGCRCGYELFHPEKRPFETDRTIGRQHGAVTPLVEAGAELPLTFPDEVGCGLGRHLRKVVDILRAMTAEAGAVVAFHVFPARLAGRSDANVGQKL